MTEQKHRILVVDDDKDILELVYMTLCQDYSVLTLNESVDALEIADFYEPDLVILDIMIPKVTGYQILEFIKKHPKLGACLSIFLSAKDTSYDIKYGYKLGANLYLTKPFQPERLVKNVQMLFAQHLSGGPKRKQFSLRDVALRLKMKVGHYVSPNAQNDELAVPTDIPAGSSSSGIMKLRRPLAQEHDEVEQKKWMG